MIIAMFALPLIPREIPEGKLGGQESEPIEISPVAAQQNVYKPMIIIQRARIEEVARPESQAPAGPARMATVSTPPANEPGPRKETAGGGSIASKRTGDEFYDASRMRQQQHFRKGESGGVDNSVGGLQTNRRLRRGIRPKELDRDDKAVMDKKTMPALCRLKYFTVSFVFIIKNYKQINDRASKNN